MNQSDNDDFKHSVLLDQCSKSLWLNQPHVTQPDLCPVRGYSICGTYIGTDLVCQYICVRPTWTSVLVWSSIMLVILIQYQSSFNKVTALRSKEFLHSYCGTQIDISIQSWRIWLCIHTCYWLMRVQTMTIYCKANKYTLYALQNCQSMFRYPSNRCSRGCKLAMNMDGNMLISDSLASPLFVMIMAWENNMWWPYYY